MLLQYRYSVVFRNDDRCPASNLQLLMVHVPMCHASCDRLTLAPKVVEQRACCCVFNQEQIGTFDDAFSLSGDPTEVFIIGQRTISSDIIYANQIQQHFWAQRR